ncbi:MAG TPA: PilN domain-containing protein [Longimicrobiales bacterium]|nr:PilN domain-containing protein [Longimicrobiales bacterium]
MIEVNLLPGGRKRASKGARSLKLPRLSRGGAGEPVDRYTVFFAVAAAVALGYIGYTYLGARSQGEELELRLEQERQDSLRFAALIEQTSQLTARRDLLAQRVEVIQQIDAARYIWPHLLDEVASAVPEYLWLSEITYVGDDPLRVRVAGRAGSTFAVTNFMRRLEASRFLRGAEIQSMQLQPSEADPEDLVQVFEVVVTYEAPPLDELETVPLFDDQTAAGQRAVAAGN